MADLERLRNFCLTFPDATEQLQWGENLCFKVRGKIFAILDLAGGESFPLVVKAAPEKFLELLEIDGISRAPYLGRYQWVRLESAHGMPARELQQLIQQSYELVAAKAPKKTTAGKKAASKRDSKPKARPASPSARSPRRTRSARSSQRKA